MSDEAAVMASIHRILGLMREIEKETAEIGSLCVPGDLDFWWGALAVWRTEAELSLEEALASVGIVPARPADLAEYRQVIARGLSHLKGKDAAAQYLARWDQIEARSLALIDGAL